MNGIQSDAREEEEQEEEEEEEERVGSYRLGSAVHVVRVAGAPEDGNKKS